MENFIEIIKGNNQNEMSELLNQLLESYNNTPSEELAIMIGTLSFMTHRVTNILWRQLLKNPRKIMSLARKINLGEVWCALGNENVRIGKYKEAQKCYKRSLKINPKNVDALIGLAKIEYFFRRDLLKSVKYCDQALDIEERVEAYGYKIPIYYDMYVQKEKLQSLIERALSLEDKTPNDKIERAVIMHINALLNKSKEMLNEVFGFLELISKEFESYEYYWWTRGSIFCNEKILDKAFQCARKGLSINQNYIPLLTLMGRILFVLKRDTEAEQYLRRALELSPNNASVLFNLGMLYYALKLYSGAQKIFEDIVKLSPNDWLSWHMIGLTLYERRSPRESIPNFKRSLNIAPNYLPSILYLANSYNWLGNKDEALKYYLRAEKMIPDDLKLLFQIGKIYYEKGKYRKAKKYLEKVTSLDPRNVKALFLLGLTYNRLSKTDKAAECFKRILEINPQHADAWYELGMYYYSKFFEIKDIEFKRKAEECLRIACKLGNDYACYEIGEKKRRFTRELVNREGD